MEMQQQAEVDDNVFVVGNRPVVDSSLMFPFSKINQDAKPMFSPASIFFLDKYWCYENAEHME
eukprot:2479914-Ditylum_brightwellii.AAC.1